MFESANKQDTRINVGNVHISVQLSFRLISQFYVLSTLCLWRCYILGTKPTWSGLAAVSGLVSRITKKHLQMFKTPTRTVVYGLITTSLERPVVSHLQMLKRIGNCFIRAAQSLHA